MKNIKNVGSTIQNNGLQPLQRLHGVGKSYPNIWKRVEEMRAGLGKKYPALPNWCFLPVAAWYVIIQESLGNIPIDMAIRKDIISLAAIGTWRYTQGIYRFDQDLLTALVNTELTGDLPCDVLLRLPEWSIYIETPGMNNPLRRPTAAQDPMHGVWVHLDYNDNNRTSLRMLFNTELGLFAFYLNIGPWSLQEAVANAVAEADRNIVKEGLGQPVRDAEAECGLAKQIQPLMSLILYICSDEPDINSPKGSTPRRPEAKKTKKGLRLFAPDKPTIWRVGETIGRVLRQGKAEVSSTGNSPRTHIRRAHWHGYWTGHRDEKRFKYNWLSPIVVRGREINEQGSEQAERPVSP